MRNHNNKKKFKVFDNTSKDLAPKENELVDNELSFLMDMKNPHQLHKAQMKILV